MHPECNETSTPWDLGVQLTQGAEEWGPSVGPKPPGRPPTAVIDIGSGSARAVVMQVTFGGGVEIIAQQRVNLDLMSHVDSDGQLEPESVTKALDAIDDFVQVCVGYGVTTINAVGTAALRESRNAAEITESVSRNHGLAFRVISGRQEAAYCFVGAVHGLPVSSGLMADLGGGSLEVVGFSQRSLDSVHTLPLGSLRVANLYQLTGKPTAEDLSASFRFVKECLAAAEIPDLGPDGILVGSGGSMRLLSKLDRRRTVYPILKMHGYCINAEDLSELTGDLADASLEERLMIPGMNPGRAHSIVGGAVVAQALLEHTGARSLMVSGQGLREGLARHPQPLPDGGEISLRPRPEVQTGGLADLMHRFAPRFSQRGPRRANLARRIATLAWQGRSSRLTSSLQCAALLLDIGNAVDFYNRLERTAAVVARTDLPGFSHRESAQVAAILLVAERGRLPKRYRKTPLLTGGDKRRMGQAAAVLLVADELERRLPPDCSPDSVVIALDGGMVTVTTPAWSKASGSGLFGRWQREFGQTIQIRRGEV